MAACRRIARPSVTCNVWVYWPVAIVARRPQRTKAANNTTVRPSARRAQLVLGSPYRARHRSCPIQGCPTIVDHVSEPRYGDVRQGAPRAYRAECLRIGIGDIRCNAHGESQAIVVLRLHHAHGPIARTHALPLQARHGHCITAEHTFHARCDPHDRRSAASAVASHGSYCVHCVVCALSVPLHCGRFIAAGPPPAVGSLTLPNQDRRAGWPTMGSTHLLISGVVGFFNRDNRCGRCGRSRIRRSSVREVVESQCSCQVGRRTGNRRHQRLAGRPAHGP